MTFIRVLLATIALLAACGTPSQAIDTSNAEENGYVSPTISSPTIISGATGTATGDLTGNGGLAAAFDGDTTQAHPDHASKAVSTSGFANTVGKDWGSGNTRTIGRFTVYSPTNNSLLGGLTTATNIKLQGSNNGTDWTDLTGSVAVSASAGTVTNVTTGITTTTAYRYHRVNVRKRRANLILR